MNQPPPLPIEHPLPAERLVKLVVALGIFAGLAWLIYAPDLGIRKTCAIHEITGLPCAMCGGTRALRCAARGEWKQSWQWNPLALPAASLAFLVSMALLVEAASGWRILPSLRAPWMPILGLAILGGLLVWTLYRMERALSDPGHPLANPKHPVVQQIRKLLRSD